MNNKLKIEVYSHGFTVHPMTHHHREVIYKYNRKLSQYKYAYNYKTRRNERTLFRVFYSSVENGRYFRYHRCLLSEFLTFIKHEMCHIMAPAKSIYDEALRAYIDIQIHTVNKDESWDYSFKIKEGWGLRPRQEEAIQHTLSVKDRWRTSLIGLPPGGGKTITMLFLAELLKTRFVLIISPKFIERWLDAFNETYEITREDIAVVQGSKGLANLFKLQAMGKLDKVKIIIISNSTMRSYIKNYEEYGDAVKDEYHILPGDYLNHLKAKLLFVDEGHQDFHFNFKLASYTQADLIVVATGTLTSDDGFVRRMMYLQYPMGARFITPVEKGHIRATASFYHLNQPQYIKCITSHGYSHVEFENSIMKHVPTTLNYFRYIHSLIDEGYLRERKEGYRCLIFVSTIKMATKLVEYLNRHLGHLSINRYCEEDPVSHLMESDICVSTIISAGTGVDVSGLSCVILTQALSSSTSNQQVIGRLREMKDHNPTFYWTVCDDIPKHVEYHLKRKGLVNNRLISFHEVRLGIRI